MIKKIKAAFLKLTLVSLLVAPMMMPTLAHADIKGSLECGAQLQPGQVLSTDTTCTSTDPTTPTDKVNSTIKLVINMFSIVVGIVAVIMIVLGGLKYITSSGDSNNITSAKNTILYAIVGLVVVALAQFIVRFVLGKVN
jgi:cytochrome bd-type quinol oxidase subunit 2